MVLGLRSKHRKGASVQVDYLIHVQEIKPWPPSQSLVSVQSVLVQWENGDHKNSGSFISDVGDGKVEFSESFRLQVTLCREASKRGASSDNFQKNCLEFNLYEPRKDKVSKGQLLGSAVINLAEYGIIKDAITIDAPINLKKSSKSKAHLYVNVQPFDREHLSLSKEVSLDNDVSESVSEVTNEGNDEEIEIASFTDDEDDDASSNTSRNMSSLASESNWVSPSQSDKNGSESALAKTGTRRANDEPLISSGVASSNAVINSSAEAVKHLNGSSRPPSSSNVSSDQYNLVKDHVAEVGLSDDHIAVGKTSSNAHFEEPQTTQEVDKKAWGHKKTGLQDGPATNNLHVGPIQEKVNEDWQVNGLAGDFLEVKKHALEETLVGTLPHDATTNQAKLRSNTMAINREAAGVQATTRRDKLKHLKSVQLQFGSSENDGTFTASQFSERAKKFDIDESVRKGSKLDALNRRKQITNSFVDKKTELTSDAEMLGEEVSETYCSEVDLSSMPGEHKKTSNKVQLMEKKNEIDLQKPVHEDGLSYPSNEREETKSNCLGNNAELKSKVEMLEEELMEAAAIEIGLYSVVAEHGSSISKVHAPARRLSRFYLHACKAKTARSQALQASAARSIISGLVLVSKACGNDVPRLTFWLSNTIMLRTIVTQAVENLRPTAAPSANDRGDSKKLCQPSPYQEVKTNETGSSDEWEEPQTYVMALEKVEAWIFSRIVESIWWQTLTPHMQSTAIKNSSSKKTHAKRYALGGVEQGNFAIDLWKKAFKDACERLCPIRAGGHECGCLHVLARLVMEQLVGRLDVAMFNAILRESAEDMPTDPVSDPISDPKVLPIPAGKSSFGAGARLKNAVGNWSRWLTDLFGIDDNDSPEDNDELDNSKTKWETSFKAFRLLKALSDLMMLPFDMLADKSTRQEVCPTLAAPLIKRVLNNFVPDEFNPDPIPESILEALDSEDPNEVGEESITSFPFIAAPTIYSPPPTSSLVKLLGEVGIQTLQRSGSALLRKSYTSDDELDELDSPMTSILIDNSRSTPVSPTSTWMPNMKAGRKVVRYQLLREVWKNGE